VERGSGAWVGRLPKLAAILRRNVDDAVAPSPAVNTSSKASRSHPTATRLSA